MADNNNNTPKIDKGKKPETEPQKQSTESPRSKQTQDITGTSRENILYFSTKPIGGPAGLTNGVVKEIRFEVADYSVSPGQPFSQDLKGVIHEAFPKESEGQLTLLAGRHGTEEVANWFIKRAPVHFGLGADAYKPDTLNFAFTGTLHITIEGQKTWSIPNLVLGQGHRGLENNWWIGASGWAFHTNTDGEGAKIFIPNSDGAYFAKGFGNHRFTFFYKYVAPVQK